MSSALHHQLSRRESQIMDVLYRLGEASVTGVARCIPGAPSYNTIRVTLGILERKGHVRHRQDGPRYLYSPIAPIEKVKRSAVGHLLQTFFEGSPSKAILALLGMSHRRLSSDDLDEIARWIEEARREDR